MGIDTQYIVPEMQDFIPLITCSICTTVFENVITIKCNHHFCKSCLLKWIHNERIGELESVPCPKCRIGFNPTRDTYKCQPMCEWLAVLNFVCSHPLCEERICYDRYHGHKNVCHYSPIMCKFCEIEVLRKDVNTHLLSCISFIKNQKSQLEVENKILKTANDRLKTKTNNLETKNTLHEAAYDLLFMDLLKTDSRMLENNSLKINNDKVLALKIERDSLKTKLELVKTESSSLNINLKTLKTETDSIIYSLKTEIDTLKLENNSQKADNDAIKIELVSLKTTNTSLEMELKKLKTETDSTISLLITENNTMKLENNLQKTDIDNVKVEMAFRAWKLGVELKKVKTELKKEMG